MLKHGEVRREGKFFKFLAVVVNHVETTLTRPLVTASQSAEHDHEDAVPSSGCQRGCVPAFLHPGDWRFSFKVIAVHEEPDLHIERMRHS